MIAPDNQQPQDGSQPETEESQTDAPQTDEDKLAQKDYSENSSESALTKQVILALSMAGVGYGGEVVSAYSFLKKPLDPEKLMTDSAYKARVERAVQLVTRHEKKRRIESGKSKYSKIVPQTNLALSQVKTNHNQLGTIKEGMAKQYAIDMKQAYGFDDKEIQTIQKNALAKIRENPTLSMQETMRKEARHLYQKRVTDKGKAFLKQSEPRRQTEQFYSNKQTEAGKKQVADALGVELKPAGQAVPSTPSRRVSSSAPPAATKISFPGTSSIKGKISDFLKKSAALQAFRVTMRNAIAYSLRSLRRAGLRSVAKLGLALSKKAFPFLFKAGATALGATASLGTSLLIQAGLELGKRLPLVGGVVRSAEAAMFGVLKVGLIIILVIAVGVPALLLIFLSSQMDKIPAYSAGDRAMKVAFNQKKTLSWQEYERKYLTKKSLSWWDFEKENLILNSEFISLESNFKF